MLGIGDYLWRLIPANPILLRVVEAGGRRRRDLFIRSGYLGLLVALVIFSLLTRSSSQSDLAQLAATSATLFQQMSYLQLALVALLSPIFTAGAITQEKDSQTYDILLATPLTNGQIVLGSLLSRLFFVIALLISGIPIFSITQIFGGVAISRIVLSFLIAAATAFVTGALAMAIATFKVGTRRTIFSFYLFVVIYLFGMFLIDRLPYFHLTLPDGRVTTTSWFTGLHPFLALETIFSNEEYMPPDLGSLPPALQAWPLGWYLSNPASFYISFMFFLSLILVLPSIVLLRKVAQSTVSLKGWALQKLRLSKGDRTRKPRYVWSNPIAWREARTKASAARASIIRYSFILAGLIGAIVLVVMFSTVEPVKEKVTANSYNSSNRTLSIYSGDRAETLRLSPITAVRINGQQSTVDKITGDFQVTNQSRQGTTLVSIDLVDIPRRISAKQTRSFLLGAVIVEFAVILLIVTNAAASTVTREKEDGTLDLLLTTPITSRYYIWGKLRGLVSYVLPLVAVPIASILIFVISDLFRRMRTGSGGFQWIVFPESILILPGTFIIVAAFASIVGMQMSLRCRKTVIAVMASLGIVVGLCAMLGFCGNTFVSEMRSAPEIAMAFASFSPFTTVTVLIDPYTFGGRAFDPTMDSDITTARLILILFGWAATGAYGLVVWWIYKSMVKNFDMTIRKQSR